MESEIKTHQIPGAGNASCHEHDVRWITENMRRLPGGLRNKVLKKYSSAYLETLEANRGLIASENLARREANTRLRIFIEKYENK